MEYQVRVTESAIEDINLILTNLKENTLSTKIVQDAEEKIKNKIISLKMHEETQFDELGFALFCQASLPGVALSKLLLDAV